MASMIDRPQELEMFDRVFSAVRRHGQLFLVIGRHGAGKTTLVQQWLASRRKRAFYWTASAAASEPEQAADFSEKLRHYLRTTSTPARPYVLETWRGAFFQLSQAAQKRPQIIVIDQVTDILVEHGGFASALQQAWDQELQHRPVLLILIGDHYGRAYEHLRSYTRAPLYGRFTAIWQAEPIPWADFSTTFRRWPVRDRLLAYAVTGGWPAFVKAVEPSRPPRKAMAQLISSIEYRDSVHAILDQFEPARRAAIVRSLRALAQGAASQLDLAQRSRLTRRGLNAALVDLDIAELVKADDIPIEGQLSLSQRTVFRLTDQQVRFYFRFLENSSKASSQRESSPTLSWGAPEIGRFLAEFVAGRLLLPWLARVGPRKKPIGLLDRTGPLPGMPACDSALAVVDPEDRQVLICGVVGQARPLGERSRQAFERAATSLVSSSWPGYSGRSLLVSLSGFTPRALLQSTQSPLMTMDVTELAGDLSRLKEPLR